MVVIAHDGDDIVKVVFSEWRTIHSDPRNKLVSRRERLRGVCCGIDKQLAELAGGTSVNICPAQACLRDTLFRIFNGIL